MRQPQQVRYVTQAGNVIQDMRPRSVSGLGVQQLGLGGVQSLRAGGRMPMYFGGDMPDLPGEHFERCFTANEAFCNLGLIKNDV